ncbi:HDOD domain-containing protein [candidate division KSB1 bacterium]
MVKTDTEKNSNGYNIKLTESVSSLFASLTNDSVKVIEAVSSNELNAQKFSKALSQKILNIDNKIKYILQLHNLEKDEFGLTREAVDICEEIKVMIKGLLKSSEGGKTQIDIKFPKEKPLLRLNKIHFLKWFMWGVNKLYNEKTIIHIIIDVSYRDNQVFIQIGPKRTTEKKELVWNKLDWLLASKYFFIENGALEKRRGGGIQISLNAVIDLSQTDESKRSVSGKELISRIKEGEDLPTLSQVAIRIINMASDETVSAQDIGNVITLDPALTARLIRIVNSPFYGFSKKITSVPQAVAILGMKAVRTLSLCISVLDNFPREDSDKNFDYHDYWQRSFASAIACKLTSKTAGLRIDEEAFVAGLTQNIGSLIIAKNNSKRYANLLEKYHQGEGEIQYLEDTAWGIDHTKLGYEVFSRWNMPDILKKAIMFHHTPEIVPDDDPKLKNLVNLTYLSDLAARVLFDENIESVLKRLREGYNSIFGFSEDETDALMEQVSEETDAVAMDFDVKITQHANYAQILQNANVELGKINLDYEQMTRELVREKKKTEKLAKELKEANILLEEEVNRDGLTKLYNHRFFFELVNKEFASAKRYKLPLSCIMLDLDYFKKINDEYGHPEGDAVLENLGVILIDAIREGDSAARYGGEEFTIILPNTPPKEAEIVAERIRRNVEKSKLSQNLAKGKVTISVGVASLVDGNLDKASDLVERADNALYQAKDSGRNRVVVFKQNS